MPLSWIHPEAGVTVWSALNSGFWSSACSSGISVLAKTRTHVPLRSITTTSCPGSTSAMCCALSSAATYTIAGCTSVARAERS